jgi:hypothetical protein
MHDGALEGTIRMRKAGWAALTVAVVLPMAVQVLAQGAQGGQGRAVVTIFAKHNEVAPTVTQQDVSVKVNGKDSAVTSWAPFKGADDRLELILLIDGNARNLGRQFDEIAHFIQGLGPGAKAAFGTMQNGNAVLAGPLSADHKQVVSELHLPIGASTGPYFSLSDLAKRWPSNDPRARREVVLFSDGVDPSNRRFDPDDPYVQAAIDDSVHAGLVVYTIYWRSGPGGDSNSLVANGGQSLMSEVADATGGHNYQLGTDNPVTFQPFFDDLLRRFANQYALEFSARPDRKPAVETLKLKVEGLGLQVTAPQQVFVSASGPQ